MLKDEWYNRNKFTQVTEIFLNNAYDTMRLNHLWVNVHVFSLLQPNSSVSNCNFIIYARVSAFQYRLVKFQSSKFVATAHVSSV